jgi:hypothetical protein
MEDVATTTSPAPVAPTAVAQVADPQDPDAPAQQAATRKSGPFRRVLARLTKDDQQVLDEGLQGEVRSCGATAVVQCAQGGTVRVAGTLRCVTFRPLAGLPTLEAELYDGSGALALVWLGRRRIAGVTPGRSIVAHGRLVEVDGRRVIYNPAYELRPSGDAA